MELTYNLTQYQGIKNNRKSLKRMTEVSKKIWDDTDLMFKILIPKYHTVKNFGKGTFNFLDRGFAYYQMCINTQVL